MKAEKIRVGIVGAGAISDIYIQNMMHRFECLEVKSICSKHMEHAVEKAEQYGLKAYPYSEMLADDEIDMIVNLTPVGVHYELIKEALMAGKHVYTEKTITQEKEQAEELLRIANEKNLYLGAAPDTFLGSSLQTARAAIDEGKIGTVTSIAVAANRNNDFLTSRFAFLREPGAGILKDYSVYYITALVSLLGPVSQVASYTRTLYEQRTNILSSSPEYGQVIQTPNESIVSAIMQFENGITGTLHINAESNREDRADMVVYGTEGMLFLGDPNAFGKPVKLIPGGPFTKDAEMIALEPVNGYSDNCRGIGPAEMATAILQNKSTRVNKEMAYHVLDVICALEKSAQEGRFVDVVSTCERPEPYI